MPVTPTSSRGSSPPSTLGWRARCRIAWRISVKEMKDLRRDGRLRWGMAAVLLLVAASLMLSWQDFQSRQMARRKAELTAREQWEHQGDKHPHSAAHFGQYAFTPDSAAAVFDPGLRAYTGTAVWLEPHRRNGFLFRAAEDMTMAVRHGLLTPALLFQVVVPLLIVALSFASVAGEREAGTLRFGLSLGITPGQLYAGKTLGIALAAAPFIALLMMPLAVLGAAQITRETGGADAFTRLLSLIPVYLLYWGTWLFVGVGVSSHAANAQRSLTILLALWVLGVLLAPRLGTFLTQQFAPSTSAEIFAHGIQSDLDKGIDGNSPPEKRYEQLVEQTLKAYGARSLEELPVGFGGIRLRAGDAYSENVHDRHFDALHGNWRRQGRLHLAASIVSPLVATRALSQALAGTDVAHHIHFSQAAEMYRRYFVNRTSEEISLRSRGTDWDVKAGNELWKSIEPFAYRAPSAIDALGGQWPAVIILGAWFLGAAGFGYWSLQRINFE